MPPESLPDLDAPHAFDREDATPDAVFHQGPRLVVHLDTAGVAAVQEAYRVLLPAGGRFLELGASWKSHLPPHFAKRALIGLGRNASELSCNPHLDERLVHDLNADPRLPFADAAFDGVFCTNAVPYLARPVELFSEVRRILKPRRPFVVVFGRRRFSERAVRIWNESDDAGRVALVTAYFRRSSTPLHGWDSVVHEARNENGGLFSEPVHVVHALADAANITLSAGGERVESASAR